MGGTLKRGTEIDLDIQSLAFGGRGVARSNGLVVFVENSIPGQKVRARILRKKRRYAEARSVQVLEESSEAVTPRCPHFGECGGCRFQNLHYEAQLRHKHHQVVESLEHLGAFKAPPVQPTLPSPDLYYYRNKMEFSFGQQRWLTKSEIDSNEITKPKGFALGLHVRGRFDKILDLDTCYLQSPFSAEVLSSVREFALESGIPAYTTNDHSGFWRHLVIREGKNTGETMINIVTAERPKAYQHVDNLAQRLLQQFADRITTIVHTINRKKAEVATGNEERVLHGPGTIKEEIGTCLFRISASSFFQTNTKGAEILYNKVIEFAEFNEEDTVFDLYSGAGTIALFVANRVHNVIGFEIMEDAVKDSRTNAELNGAKNCTFVPGDLKDSLKDILHDLGESNRPTSIVIDPPRAGMHADVLNCMLRLKPQKIVYVSCNPTTFARDAKQLCESDYQLEIVQPVDMFPHTAHIELVSLLWCRVS